LFAALNLILQSDLSFTSVVVIVARRCSTVKDHEQHHNRSGDAPMKTKTI
jgi:hypothetical protein